MAINAELQSRRNSTRQKVKQQNPTPVIEETSDSGRDRTQLVRATRDLGGNPSPAFVSNSSIPTLERNVVNTYEQNTPKPTLSRIAGAMMGAVLQKPNAQTMQAARTNNNNYAAAQRNNQLYNDLKTEDVDRILNNLGQTDIAMKPNEQFVESIKSNGGSTNPFDYKNFWDFQANSPLGGAALFDVLSAESHKFERQNLTPEMVRAGLTEKDLEIWNNARNEEERQQVLSQWAAEHPIVSTARSFPENIGGSLENVANILGSYATGTPMESKPSRAEIYRNAVSEGIDSGVGRFAYNAGTSAGDMILASLIAGPAGAAAPAIGAGTMGIEKASATANDAIDRGLNPNQIIAEMAGSGVTTALTELIPFNNMFKGASILKGMASEGGQEIAEDIADTLLDELVTGLGRNHDKSSLSTSYHQYLDAGYTPYEAVINTAKDYGKQLIMDGALGAVSGGAVQGGYNLVQGRNFITGELPSVNNEIKTKNSQSVLTDLANLTNDIVDNPSMEKWNSFVETAERLAQENPDIADKIEEVYKTVEKFYEDNEAAIPDTINGNVDNVNENVDIPAVNAQEEVKAEPIPAVTNPVEQTVEQTQPEVVQEARVPRREVSAVRRMTEGLNNKLDVFENETDIDVEPLKAQLDEAYNNVINSTGNAQAEAIQNFNNTVNAINEQMAGATINQSARDFNQEGYNNMRSVTDGRRIAITDAQRESTGYRTLRDLNSAVYSGNPNSTIKFYAEGALNTVPLDNVYNEMRYLSNGELPAVLAGDQLNALVDWIRQYKSQKGDTVEVANWDRMKIDNRSNAESTIDDIADDTLDRIEDGNITAEEMGEVFDKLSELQRKDPRLAERISQLYQELSAAMMERISNADVYDPDIEAATEDNIDELAEEVVGEIPRRHNDTAGVKTGRLKKSDVFSNTGVKGGMVNEKIRELEEKYGHMMYENNTEPESMEEAAKRLERDGEEKASQELMHKSGWTNVDTDEMMMIYHDAKAYAESLDAEGENSDEAWEYAFTIFEKIKEEGSREGQALQALAKWSRSNTPEGLLAEATSIIEKAKKGEDWNKAVARETKNAVNYDENGKPIRTMDVNFMREFMAEAKKLESLEPNSREFKHVYDNLGKMINTQIPSGMIERVRTLLMDNMLGNARTLLTRNAGGNIGFNLIEQLLRKPLSALIDSAVSKKRGTARTVGDVNAFTKEGRDLYKAWGRGAKDAVAQEWYDFKNGIHSSRSGETNLANATGNNRTVFKNNKTNQAKGLNYLLNKADNLVRYGLSFGDRWAYEATYSQTLAELQQLYDQGKLDRKYTNKDGKVVAEKMTEAEFKKYAEDQAKINALEACYQDDSEMAEAFLAARKLVNKLSRATIGVDVLSQFTIPFAKTPANIIQRAIEYSPLGLAKNAIQTIREVNSDAGLNQRRFSVDTSRNIIGSALFALGIFAARAGRLTGAYSDDPDMKEAQKEAGMQEYALDTGDKNISIDWIPVLGNNAVAASAFYNAMQNNPELSMSQRFGQGLSEGLKTQFESSALQGLNRFIAGSGFNNSNGDLVSNAKDTLKSGLTQFIPSLLRQYAAATDPYRRQLSGANPDDYYYNAVLNSIPGLRETLEPRIGRTGEYMEQNPGRSTFQKWMDNFLNPATVTVTTPDSVRDEAMRLFESTGNADAFQAGVSIKDLKTDDHVPTAEEYTQYQQASYTAMNQIASDLIQSDYYQTLTDGERESMLADIYSAIKSVEKLNILDGDKSNLNGAAKAYDEGGADGLLNYMIARNTLAQMGISNNESNREQILATLNQGGTQAVQQMVDQSQELEAAGLNTNMQFKYEHAQNYIPNLSPTDFANTWNAINTDGNTSIKQSEIIDYLNQDPESHVNDAMMYWQAYGDGSWTSIPVLGSDGTWTTQRSSSSSNQTTSVDSIGQYGLGNIDLYNRPQYVNPDGSVSTVLSMSFNDGSGEILIPTVAYNSQGQPYIMSDDEAIAHYYQTGEYLGKFNTVKEAEDYAELLHQQQEQLYGH